MKKRRIHLLVKLDSAALVIHVVGQVAAPDACISASVWVRIVDHRIPKISLYSKAVAVAHRATSTIPVN
jgi:hypothetical protein